jgi:hypothetical protein
MFLSIMDLRIIPLEMFDVSDECVIFFMDCFIASLENLILDSIQNNMDEKQVTILLIF